MCLPAAGALMAAGSAATAGSTLAIASMGLQAVGAYQQASAQKAQANYNAAVAERNAQVSEYQAQDAIRRGEEDAAKVRRQADQVKGAQRAGLAAKGLDLTQGTAQELQDQTDFFGLTDVATTRNNAQREAWGKRQQGANYTAEAGMQRATASSINPWMAAGTSIIGNASSVAKRWYS